MHSLHLHRDDLGVSIVPLYDFVCQKCDNEFEMIVSFSAKTMPACPNCDADQVERKMGLPAIHFKGSGWYINDSKKSKDASSSNNKKEDSDTSSSTDSESSTSDASSDSKKSESKESSPKKSDTTKSDSAPKKEKSTPSKKNTKSSSSSK